MSFSQYQQDIFKHVADGRESAVIEAVAGSGKTTTIVECAQRIPSSKHATFVAFNKAIANELSERLPKHIPAKTLNGLGHGAWMHYTGNRRLVLNAKKTQDLARQMLSPADAKLYFQGVCKLVSLAKSVGLVPRGIDAVALTHDLIENWFEIIDHYDVEFEEGATDERGVELARELLKRSIEISKQVIDFDDQIYMPVIMRAKFWQNDLLFVDEAQDVNQIQRAMLKRALKPGGRIIAVGDPCQAIYGFRGADCNAIDNIKSEFSAITLPLSISYRCAKRIVTEAQQYVSHIQAFECAPEGTVGELSSYSQKMFRPTDGVVCRQTAPLIDLAYKIMRSGVGCRVLGREIGQGLTNLIRRMKASSIEVLLDRLDLYFERESAKYMAKGKEELVAALDDRITTIKVFIEQLDEDRRSVTNLIEKIESLFTDNGNGVLTLCTVHKSKGLEWDRVFILEPGLMPSKYARQAWQQQQEINLQYVATTRAKSELYYITVKGFKCVSDN